MADENENLIEITDDDGTVIKCELYDIIEFEDKQYALLVEVNDEDEEKITLYFSIGRGWSLSVLH